MPSVTHASMPRPRTPRTMSSTLSKAAPSFTSRQAAPMQKRVAPAALAAPRLSSTSSTSSIVSRLTTGARSGRLRAICAVLGAAARLDREQARELHFAVGVVAPVHRARPIDQFEQGSAEERDNLAGAPIVAGFGAPIGFARALRLVGLAVDRIRAFQGFCHGRCVAIAGRWALR